MICKILGLVSDDILCAQIVVQACIQVDSRDLATKGSRWQAEAEGSLHKQGLYKQGLHKQGLDMQGLYMQGQHKQGQGLKQTAPAGCQKVSCERLHPNQRADLSQIFLSSAAHKSPSQYQDSGICIQAKACSSFIAIIYVFKALTPVYQMHGVF
ncbi:hypothetical protein MTO96_029691 [Rhipicephalus appendiculatus]